MSNAFDELGRLASYFFVSSWHDALCPRCSLLHPAHVLCLRAFFAVKFTLWTVLYRLTSAVWSHLPFSYTSLFYFWSRALLAALLCLPAHSSFSLFRSLLIPNMLVPGMSVSYYSLQVITRFSFGARKGHAFHRHNATTSTAPLATPF